MFRFTIRDVLLVMVIVALALGWWVDHSNADARHQADVAQLKRFRETLFQVRIIFLVWQERFRDWALTGGLQLDDTFKDDFNFRVLDEPIDGTTAEQLDSETRMRHRASLLPPL